MTKCVEDPLLALAILADRLFEPFKPFDALRVFECVAFLSL